MNKNLLKVLGLVLILNFGFKLKSIAQCPVTAIASTTKVNCGQPVSLTAKITVEKAFEINFNSGADSRVTVSSGAVYNNPCNKDKNGTQYLWFGGGNPARTVTTQGFDFTEGGTLCFSMRYAAQGGDSPCEGVDAPDEGVYVQYSIDNGTNWTTINYFDPKGGNDATLTSWNEYCFNIPEAAKTANTKLRWMQSVTSLPIQSDYDHWGLEDIYVLRNLPNTFYKWSHTGVLSVSAATPDVFPFSDTSYTVTYYINGDSCSSTVNIQTTLPSISVTKDKDNVCPGTVVQLNAFSTFQKEVPTSCSLNSGPGCDEFSISSEIQVGNGNVVQGYTTDETFGGQQVAKNHSQFLILASDLIAAGFKGGQFNSIAVDVDNLNASNGSPNPAGFETFNNFSVGLKCTNQTSIGSFDGSVPQVYAPKDLKLKVGINWIYFTKTYNWDGKSNILVDFCWWDNNNTLRHAKLRHRTTGYNSHVMYPSNSNYGNFFCESDNTFQDVVTFIPNLKFGVCNPGEALLEYTWTPSSTLDNPNIRNPKASPTEITTYTVAVNEVGKPDCKVFKTITVNTTNPIVSVNPLVADICPGQNVSITAIATPNGNTNEIIEFTKTNTNTTDTIPSRQQNQAYTGVTYPLSVTGITPALLTPSSVYEVCVNIDHPRVNELTVKLKSPSGIQQVILLKRGGTAAKNFKGCFSDNAPVSIKTAAPPFTGSYRPELPFSGFTGNANGVWELTVYDSTSLVAGIPLRTYSGHFNSWSLKLVKTFPNFIKTYEWTPSTGLSRTDSPRVVATPAVTTEYNLKVTDANNCITNKKVKVNVGTSQDLPIISSNSPICEGDSIKLFTTEEDAIEYNWTGPNGFVSQEKNPFIANATSANAGKYSLQVKNAAGCVSGIPEVQMVINPKDDATFSYSSSTICQTSGVNPIPSKNGSVAGTFTASPSGITFIDNSTGEIDLMNSNVGSYIVSFQSNGTCPGISSTSLTISGAPDATFSYPQAEYCKSEMNPLPVFTPTSSAGKFEVLENGLIFKNSSTGEIDLNLSAPGVYTVINKIAANGSCAESLDNFTVEIKALPNPGFQPDKKSICISENKINLNPIINGGIFSGEGIINQNEFDPAIAGIGNHKIKYEIIQNGCADSSIQFISVFALPDPSFTGLKNKYCASESLVELIPAKKGGKFFGPGISDNFFFPSIAGTGNFVIKYIVQNENGCADSSFQNVEVIDAPDPDFSGLSSSYCSNDLIQTLVPNISGGTFYGPGVNGNTFDPSKTGAGTFQIKYIVSNENNCVDSSIQNVTVTNRANAFFDGYENEYCFRNPAIELFPAQQGGKFSGNGINGNFFDPSTAGVGSHKIKYIVFTDGQCPDSSEVTIVVNANPDATFTGLQANYCVTDGEVTLNPKNSGGVFSGKGVSGNKFNPASAGVGTFAIKYVIVNSTTGCSDSTLFSVKVNALPNAAFSGLNAKYCEGDADVTLVPTVAGGTFKGTGIVGNKFSPETAGVGTYTITYIVKNGNNCTDSSKKTVTVNPFPDVNAGNDVSICFGKSSQIGVAPVAGNTYKWTPAAGLNNPNISNPVANPTATTKYTLTVTSQAGCIADDEMTVTVNPLPIANFGFTISDKTFTATADKGNGITEWIWDFGDRSLLGTGAAVNHVYLQCETYDVMLKVISPCGVDSIIKTIKTCKDSVVQIGIENNELINKFNVSPNPFQNNISIKFDLDKNSKLNFALYNGIGQKMNLDKFDGISNKEYPIGNHEINLDLGQQNLPTGIYHLSIFDGKKLFDYKLNKIK